MVYLHLHCVTRRLLPPSSLAAVWRSCDVFVCFFLYLDPSIRRETCCQLIFVHLFKYTRTTLNAIVGLRRKVPKQKETYAFQAIKIQCSSAFKVILCMWVHWFSWLNVFEYLLMHLIVLGMWEPIKRDDEHRKWKGLITLSFYRWILVKIHISFYDSH